MATESENYKFQKPEDNEYYDVGVQNKNWDILDEVLSAHEGNKENPHSVTPEQIGAATPEYVDKQIALVTETGIPKLMVYPLSVTATEDNQTTFPIDLSTFDVDTDTVLVQSGRTMLFPNQDFTVNGSTVVLNEGVPSGRTIGIYVFKNVPLGEDGSVSGQVIAAGSLPLDRLEEMPTPEQVGAAASFNAYGKTLAELLSLSTSHVPFVFGLYWSSAIAPDSNTCSCIGTNGVLWAFSYSGRIFMCTNAEAGWVDVTGKYLPLTGGCLTENLKIKKTALPGLDLITDSFGRVSLTAGTNNALLETATDVTYNNLRRLALYNSNSNNKELKDAVQLHSVINGVSAGYSLFGNHNKPSGSYTGNGSSTSRAIETGGLSDCIIISNVDKGAVVTPCGAIGFTTSGVEVIPYLQAHFVNGVLTLATTSEIVNKSGNTYYYKCL